jgi:hypothetical protein
MDRHRCFLRWLCLGIVSAAFDALLHRNLAELKAKDTSEKECDGDEYIVCFVHCQSFYCFVSSSPKPLLK